MARNLRNKCIHSNKWVRSLYDLDEGPLMGCSCLSSNTCDLDPIRTFLSFTLLFIAAASSHVDDREGKKSRGRWPTMSHFLTHYDFEDICYVRNLYWVSIWKFVLTFSDKPVELREFLSMSSCERKSDSGGRFFFSYCSILFSSILVSRSKLWWWDLAHVWYFWLFYSEETEIVYVRLLEEGLYK